MHTLNTIPWMIRCRVYDSVVVYTLFIATYRSDFRFAIVTCTIRVTLQKAKPGAI